ncbi:hypothetical protein Athai_46260 [Actinocatenispora thailandica]|uniref:DUF4397 domain-containing protein n=1 Tax=Actinocatenispora thailandica TaxID=227318 RepID=A0A7R7DSR0_9ACTN|nr:hypothetical protein [Actinocatenispora thailandica]BCJ37123.1 hypothetical protein Athai_46260 [Actinocatenispora thailandica]
MRRAVAAVTIGAAMLCTAGCATPPGGSGTTSPTPSPSASGSTVPAAFTTAVGRSYRGIKTTKSLTPSKAVLVGPHSFLQLDRIARTTTLTADQIGVAQLGDQALPAHARSGYEFVLAHLTPNSTAGTGVARPGLPGYDGDALNASKAAIVVDGTSRSVPGQLFADETIIVSVPAGAPVALRMNDGGRAQDLDLRTGKRTRTASPLYYPVREASPSFDDDYYVTGPHSSAGLSSASGKAVLAPYADKLGWARKGRAWLFVTVGFTTSSMSQFKPNVARSLTLTAGGTTLTGHATSSGDTTSDPNSVGGAGGHLDLAFDVPASLRSGTLNYLPVGSFVVDDKTVSATPYQGGDPRYDTGVQHKHVTLKPRS